MPFPRGEKLRRGALAGGRILNRNERMEHKDRSFEFSVLASASVSSVTCRIPASAPISVQQRLTLPGAERLRRPRRNGVDAPGDRRIAALASSATAADLPFLTP